MRVLDCLVVCSALCGFASFLDISVLPRALARSSSTLHHKPGKSNKADPLSRQPDHNMGHDDNVDVIVLKEEHFRQHQIRSLDDHIRSVKVNIFDPEEWMADLKDHSHIEDMVLKGLREKDSDWKLKDGLIYFRNLLYIPPTNKLREKIIFAHHDKPMAGHPGKVQDTGTNPMELLLATYATANWKVR